MKLKVSMVGRTYTYLVDVNENVPVTIGEIIKINTPNSNTVKIVKVIEIDTVNGTAYCKPYQPRKVNAVEVNE